MAGGEAPDLAAMVKAGTLPPVAERLPEDPFVVDVIDGIGKYGGTWRRAIRAASAWAFWGYVIKENEIRYDMNITEIVPVLWKDYSVSADKKTFTFYLREGLKWSDGDPLDADDYAFWWDHMISNDEYAPAKPNWLKAGGELATFKVIDRYTIQFSWKTPYGVFLDTLAQPRFDGGMTVPSHYLKQFHPAFAAKADIDKMMKDGGFNTWMDLFGNRNTKHLNPERPGVEAWIPLDDNTGAVMRFERNPYYWKVDPAGNQLPYIDRIEQQLLQDAESCLLKALAGEIDFQYREITGLDNYPLFQDVKDKVGIRTVVAFTMHSNIHTNFLNYTIDDPVKRQLFSDLRFRQALSLAIDREQINTLLHKGLSPPAQLAPPAGDPAREEDVAKYYTEFDLAKANALLDEIGLKWDANKRFRLGPDGKPLQFVKIFYTSWPSSQAEAQDLIKQTWAKIGIDVINKPIERSLWTEQMRTNDYEMSAYATNTGGGAYLPTSSDGVFPIDIAWYPEPDWGNWFATNGAAGTEPPADVKRSMDLYKEYVTTASPDRMTAIEKEAFRLYSTNLWAIGVGDRPAIEVYYVANVKLKNLPQENVIDDVTFFHPAQWYYED
jgi:peptide/nickel transport system substrate-binding protein